MTGWRVSAVLATVLVTVLALTACVSNIAAGGGITTSEETDMSEKPPMKPGAVPPPAKPPTPSGAKPGGAKPGGRPGAEAAPMPAAKRSPPPRIEPVEIDGVSYRQQRGSVEGIAQASGLLAAYTGDSDQPDWVIPVYAVVYIEELERDVQEVYFTSMSRRGDEHVLLIENERGQNFSVNVDVRKVIRLD